MTSAERQAAYRDRRPKAGDGGTGDRRINTWVSTSAALNLARLAQHQGITQRALLEKLLEQAYNRTTSRMDETALDDFLKVTQ